MIPPAATLQFLSDAVVADLQQSGQLVVIEYFHRLTAMVALPVQRTGFKISHYCINIQ